MRNTSARPLTRGAMRVLAVLLLADRRLVPAWELAAIATPWGGSSATIRDWWIPPLRTAGCAIQTEHPYGYRLTDLPPDELLDDLLAVVHGLRAEQPMLLWELLGRETRPPRKRTPAPSRILAIA